MTRRHFGVRVPWLSRGDPCVSYSPFCHRRSEFPSMPPIYRPRSKRVGLRLCRSAPGKGANSAKADLTAQLFDILSPGTPSRRANKIKEVAA
jgi:hypothetical protein